MMAASPIASFPFMSVTGIFLPPRRWLCHPDDADGHVRAHRGAGHARGAPGFVNAVGERYALLVEPVRGHLQYLLRAGADAQSASLAPLGFYLRPSS
jgi:hypothetical protein